MAAASAREQQAGTEVPPAGGTDGFRVSVVIPVYNAEKYVGQAIRSALEQPEVAEVLVVDDGSGDGSYAICRGIAAAEPRVRLLTHEGRVNKGVAATRNAGIQHASSPYISFLDADDYYLPDRFRRTREVFEQHPDADGVYELIQGQAEGMDPEKTAFYNNYQITYLDNTPPEELFINLYPVGKGRGFFSPDGLTVKREIFDKTGLFDTEMQTCEDLLMWCKMAAVGRFYPGERSRPVTMFRRYPGSLTSQQARVNASFVRFSDKMLDFIAPYLKKEHRLLFIDRYYFMQIFYRDLYWPGNLREYLGKLLVFARATGRILARLDPAYLFKADFYRQLAGVLKWKRNGHAG